MSKNMLLWHYTSIETMKKILESKTVRFTDSEYLNDTNEIKHGMTLICSRLKEISDEGRELASYTQTAILNAKNRKHIFSLSMESDSLPQWIAYTPKEVGGCAIGFEFSNDSYVSDSFRYSNNHFWYETGCISQAPIGFHRCTYINFPLGDDDKKYIDEILGQSVRAHKELITSRYSEKNAVEFSLMVFSNLLSSLKHQAFKTENEWRGLIYVNQEKMLTPAVTSTPKPYIEAHFNPAIIKEIKVSPHGNNKEKVLTLLEFLKNNVEYNFSISCSTAPYRG